MALGCVTPVPGTLGAAAVGTSPTTTWSALVAGTVGNAIVSGTGMT